MADIFSGAVVAEAGVGSGALAASLLNTIGVGGRLVSIERRADFAEIARANVRAWFGADHPAWEVHVGDLADVLPTVVADAGVDRVVLDMLAPWENIDTVARALVPGGVVLAYVATTTQLSRFVEDLRANGGFTEPQAWETMLRTGTSRDSPCGPTPMVGHTGFLVTARRLAPGTNPPQRVRRPAPGARAAAEEAAPPTGEAWTPEALGERTTSERKVRRVRRDLDARAAYDDATTGGRDDA
jgi:tRNA (adenine57-N1/adenine58-N1)-methyltransferase